MRCARCGAEEDISIPWPTKNGASAAAASPSPLTSFMPSALRYGLELAFYSHPSID